MLKRINSFYVFIAVMFVGLLAVNNAYFKGSSSFLGVTYAKEHKINVEKSATVLATHVVPGQTVQPGDLLVELESPELTLEIEKLKQEIALLKSQKEERQKLIESELQLLYSEKKILQTEIENEIMLLRNRLNLNRSLTDSLLRKTNRSLRIDSLSSLEMEIAAIRAKGNLELEAVDIKIQDLKQDHQYDQSQLQSRIDLTQQELEWKLEKDRQLNKFAEFPGVIENVYVKPNEQVEAFTALVSINPVHPTSAVGYLVGKKDRDKMLGESVVVRSLEHPEFEVNGRIIGFGSVVSLPNVLQKTTTIETFGLEVFIEIPEENGMPVGEKIIIQ